MQSDCMLQSVLKHGLGHGMDLEEKKPEHLIHFVKTERRIKMRLRSIFGDGTVKLTVIVDSRRMHDAFNMLTQRYCFFFMEN